jgi:biopolymer transport protein ExbD
MARRSRIAVEDDDTELNMTPMLDVVFILLIFFIVTSVFVKMPGVDPNEPMAVTSQDWKPSILVAVNDANEIWIDKQVYDLDEVSPIVRALRDENPKAQGIIQGDGDAEVGTILDIQTIFQDLGVPVRVKTEPR